MTWYYHQNGENKGPVSPEELRRLRQGNLITDDTLVWEQGMPQWAPYRASAALTTAATVPLGTGYDLQPCSECGRAFPPSEMVSYEGRWICPTCKPLFFQRLREGVTRPGTMVYASFWARLAAALLDGILIFIVLFTPLFLMFGILGTSPVNRAQMHVAVGLNILVTLLQYFGPALYTIIMISRYGATLGCMALKLKIVMPDGSRIGYGRSTGRYFAQILSGCPTLFIGYLMMLWDPENRTLHDRICNTRVINLDA